MCKDGKLLEAYELAKVDASAEPDNVWSQRELGWALYYLIRNDAATGDYPQLLNHIDELQTLSLLTMATDAMIFDNVQLKVAEFIKNHLSPDDADSLSKLSAIFARLRQYSFGPSVGHSYILRCVIKFAAWPEMADFLDWWDLATLTSDDFTPYFTPEGKKMMTLAERAYIANAKALLNQSDASRIEAFLPKLDALMTAHPEMTYPGYFYGKMLIKLGTDAGEALKVIAPFARRKAGEFWVWQLLSEVFASEDEKRLACLLRAVNCRARESFLGKVRIKLAEFYAQHGLAGQARFHIDSVARAYAENGWRMPREVADWATQPWFRSATPDESDPTDYMAITDDILCYGAATSIGIVTHVDPNSKKAVLICGHEQRVVKKLNIDVAAGDILRLRYVTEAEGHINILTAEKAKLPDGLDYARHLDGIIVRREGQPFAFLKARKMFVFVPPSLVASHDLTDGDRIKGIIVRDFSKKKESWEWVCVGVRNVFAAAKAAA